MKRLLLLILIPALLLSGCASSGRQITADNPLVVDGSQVSQPSSTAIAYIDITASQLLSEYQNNEVAADLKYKGRMLRVSGIVESVGTDILGSPYIVVVESAGDWSGVQCVYPQTTYFQQLLAELNTGDAIAVTGECEGYPLSLHVVLKH